MVGDEITQWNSCMNIKLIVYQFYSTLAFAKEDQKHTTSNRERSLVWGLASKSRKAANVILISPPKNFIQIKMLQLTN